MSSKSFERSLSSANDAATLRREPLVSTCARVMRANSVSAYSSHTLINPTIVPCTALVTVRVHLGNDELGE